MKKQKWIFKPVLIVTFCLVSIFSFAQDPTDSLPTDPGAFSVYTAQNMAFGTFSGGTGGTITISNTGTRSVTGSVVALNIASNHFQSMFEVEAPIGSIISIMNGPNATLTGSNGGSLILSLGPSNPASTFSSNVQPPGRTIINIGGTLTVGNFTASPPGNYTGTFYVTFNQE